MKYLLNVRASLDGPVVSAWHEIDEGDTATKGVLFGMTMAAKVNMDKGPLLITSALPWTADDVQSYLRTLSQPGLQEFFSDAALTQPRSE